MEERNVFTSWGLYIEFPFIYSFLFLHWVILGPLYSLTRKVLQREDTRDLCVVLGIETLLISVIPPPQHRIHATPRPFGLSLWHRLTVLSASPATSRLSSRNNLPSPPGALRPPRILWLKPCASWNVTSDRLNPWVASSSCKGEVVLSVSEC